MSLDRARVDRALAAMSRGLPSDAIRADAATLEDYAHDESEAPAGDPAAVVFVRSTEDVATVMRAAYAHEVPVTPRAAGTGRSGGATPFAGGVVLATEELGRDASIERADLLVVAGPGIITGDLHRAVEAEGLFYPPDPNSLEMCRLGGNLAENAGGPRAFKYGVTRDYVLGLEVVTADGTPLRVGRRTVKGVTGYDVTSLLVGSEGTLAVITQATLRLVPKPESVRTLLVGLRDLKAAGDAIAACIAKRIVPRCLELLDETTLGVVRAAGDVPIGATARAALLVEVDGDEHAIERDVHRVVDAFESAGATDIALARDERERERIWGARRSMSRALRKLAKHKLSEDVVVPRSAIPALIDRARAIAGREKLLSATYGHAGDGNLHVNFLWNERDEIANVERAVESLFREVVALRGTLTGEHGVGLTKKPHLSIEQSPELIALQTRLKATFDPKGILNPGKIFATAHKAC